MNTAQRSFFFLVVGMLATIQIHAASTYVPEAVENQRTKILASIKYQSKEFLKILKSLDPNSGMAIDHKNGLIKTTVILNTWIQELIKDNPSPGLTRDKFPARFPIAALEPLQPNPNKPGTLRFRVRFFNDMPVELAQQSYMDFEYDHHGTHAIQALRDPALTVKDLALPENLSDLYRKNKTLAIPTQAPTLVMHLPAPSTSFFNLAVIDHDPKKGGTTLAWSLEKRGDQEKILKSSLEELVPAHLMEKIEHGSPLERKEAVSSAITSHNPTFPSLPQITELISSYEPSQRDTTNIVNEWFEQEKAKAVRPGVIPAHFPIAALTTLPGKFNFRIRFLNNKKFPNPDYSEKAITESFIDMHYNSTTHGMEITDAHPLGRWGKFAKRGKFLFEDHPEYAVIEIPSQAPSLVFPLGDDALLHIIVPDHSPKTGGTKVEWWVDQINNKRQLSQEGEDKRR